jgi:hypothetical protein
MPDSICQLHSVLETSAPVSAKERLHFQIEQTLQIVIVDLIDTYIQCVVQQTGLDGLYFHPTSSLSE